MNNEFLRYEELYSQNNYFGKMINNKNYKIEIGNIPILLSAPHSVRQIRNGNIKAQDMYTGAIVDYVKEETNCFSITNVCTNNNDPNFDNISNCEYKNEILSLIDKYNIKLLIDIHGLDEKKESLIDICTDENKNIIERFDILDIFLFNFNKYLKKEEKDTISLNKYYHADKEFCISKYISEYKKIPCFELEINKIARNPYSDDFYFNDFLNVFENIINEIILIL